MKVVSVIGARPQFVKAAAVSRKLRERHSEFLIHTGQHYDYEMSGIFFDGLDIPAPDANLSVGSGSHGAQTSTMLSGIEDVLMSEHADCVLVYGDTNSTLAGALAASKLRVPVVHVEAGLRSYNRAMPEEINRVVADHLSDLLLCPSQTAIDNLGKEGITRGVSLVGDVMLDVINWARQRADRSTTIDRLQLTPGKYLLLTMHRAENTDNPDRLAGIVQALNCITEPIVFPVHPRARKMLASGPVKLRSSVHMIDPVGYLEMVALTGSARLVLTDSGGLQKEAYWLGVPCVTLRDETEWVETVDAGWNVLVGANRDAILETVRTFSPPAAHPPQYGDGFASVKCVDQLDTLQ